MRQRTERHQEAAERTLKDIRRKTRKRYSSEEKVRIVLAGLRGDDSISSKETGAPVSDERPIRAPSNSKTTAQGAATTVWCATNPSLDGLGGVYCENCEISAPVPPELIERQAAANGLVAPSGVMPYAIDRVAAERLFILSKDLLG